ncbi:hypothetical protein ASC94_24920 [Massilia sp. Root418]|jgi:hypothetical protein|uniref:DUF4214 domain-containing protein n=1 Tax=Massilia sp. Root418 TaxID=1736532 RepID=UPI0006FC40A5|nr:DUF4214 domain-containing protein [Massilia sp. Root418]KQW87758.1 hypothetical protein ASC94_24920 [Massilia sp. Root418]
MALTDDYASDKTTSGYIQAGGQTSATFEQSRDADWFRVTLAANTYYTFQLEATGLAVSPAYLSLDLYSSQGSYFSSAASSYTSSGITSTFKSVAAGDYYISAGMSYYSGTASQAYTVKSSAGVADAVGDTMQTASAMVLGVQQSGVFEGPSDIDVYKLTLEQGVSYSVKQSWVTAGGSYTSLNVTNASGQSVSLSSGSSDGYTFSAAASGVYYISTRGGSNSGEAPKYNLLAAAAADDYKAAVAGAGALVVGGSTKGRLEVGGDRDWYAVTLKADSVYWFTAKADPASTGTGYSSGNAQLKVLDSAGQVMASINGSNNQAVLQFIPTKAGTYYFEVGDGYGTTGNYVASASIGQRDDYGNTMATAASVAVGTAVRGKLELSNDADMFKVAVTAGSTYVVELTADNSVNSPDLSLSGQTASGSYGSLVSYSKAGAAEYRVFTANATGDFYLTVANSNSYGTSGYTLNVSTPAVDDAAASTGTTRLLSTGTKLFGALDYIGDVDWIKVKLAAGNKYAFVLEGQANGQGTLDLANVGLSMAAGPTGYYYGLNSMSGIAGKGYTFTAETSGDYYLAVSPGTYSTTAGTGTYALNAYNLSGDTALPALVSFAPGNGSTGASLTGNITLTFNEMVRIGDGNIRLIDSIGNVVESFYSYGSDARLQINGNVVTINPTANLQASTKYTLEIPAGSLLDYAGNKFLADSVYNFTTLNTVAQGGSGNDLLTGIGTNVRLAGGDGIDTVVYGSSWGSYTISVGATETKVWYRSGGSVGTGDVLSGVERLQFSDRNVALDVDGHGGQAYRLYQAAFNRAPDKAGLGFWMSHLDNDMTLSSVAQAFLESTEFQVRYGTLSNEAFVNSLYTNVLHRAGEAAGVAHWVGKLEQGVARADVLMGFSESGENATEILKVIGNGFEYTPYG